MAIYEVKTLEPLAETKLDEMESEHLIEKKELSKNGGKKKKPLQFGCMKGLVLYIADDFDAPLDDFEDYM